MKFGLSDDLITKVNSIFKKHHEINKVLIYGSRVKGNFHKGSDVDLTIFSNDISATNINKIKSEIDDLNTPYLFDISDYSKITSDELIEHIKRVGLIFYEKEVVDS